MAEKRIWFLTKIKGYGCIGLFFLPFILVGIWTLFYSLINIYNSQKTEGWNKVPATVEHVQLEYNSDSDGGGTYEVHIGYKYVINNKRYFGNKIAFGYGGNDTEGHSSLFNKLENSKKITVFVDPKDNSNAIIIRGINNSIIGVLIFSIMWNSLLSIFFIPLFMKEDSKFTFKYVLISVMIIWIIGISLLVSDSIKIPFEDKIEVIESKKVIEAAG
ncbi:DUF3592 domain-containing protein [Flavobacterium sp. FlaQc-57]|uniref:DUF3592 domain-containing protein n=1 Tax=Flavobacterium sp. FlaQc-57 TaxID=3374186 RepID=UPI0037574700